MALIERTWSGHAPSISVYWSYDTEKKICTVKWTCGPGHFNLSFFKFMVFLRHKDKNGNWPVSKKVIKALTNPDANGNFVNLWAIKTEQTASITLSDAFLKGQTQIGFGLYCSNKQDTGQACTENLDTATKVTDWEKITTSSNTPKLRLQDGYPYLNKNNVCALTNSLPVYWSVTGNAIKKMVMQIQEVWGSNDAANVSWVYSISAPKTYKANDIKGEGITITQCMHDGAVGPLLPRQWYDVTVAVATATESIATQWADDSKTFRVRTREESPDIYFALSGAATTTATIDWSAVFPTVRLGAPLYNLAYKLHDDTANIDVITGGVAAAADYSRQTSSGSFTISGLTIGHTYTVTADGGETQLDRVSIGNSFGCTFTAVTNPTLDAVWNMNDWSLVFGEGTSGKPSINIRIGTAPTGVWNITAYIGMVGNSGELTWLVSQVVSVGDNVIALTDATLDWIYQNINPTYSTYGFTLYVQINYSLPDGTLPGYDAKQYTMWFRGNMKTVHTGNNSDPTPRAKIWVGNGDGTAHRAIAWVGVGGIPRRTI